MGFLPPAQHQQPLQTWAGRPGVLPAPSDGPDRSSIWQTSATPWEAATEPPSRGGEGSPGGTRQARVRGKVQEFNLGPGMFALHVTYLPEQFNTVCQGPVHSTDEGVGIILLLHAGPEGLGLCYRAPHLRLHRHGWALVGYALILPPLLQFSPWEEITVVFTKLGSTAERHTLNEGRWEVGKH